VRKLFTYLSIVILCITCLALTGKDAEAKDADQILKAMDSNGDGQIDKDEWKQNPKGFRKIDDNNDGFLSRDELIRKFGGGSNDDQKPTAPNHSANTTSVPVDGVWNGPIIDVHSQIDEETDLNSIVPMLDRAGVSKVMLSTRFKQPSSDVLELAARHPERIIPAAKSKTKAFTKGQGDYAGKFKEEIELYDYRAIAEVIMWHAAKKGVGAGQSTMEPGDARVAMMIEASRQKNIPFIAHIEFGAMGSGKSSYLEKMDAFIAANRDVPIGLIHMGQLDADDAAQLLPRHSNLFFITSHCNPIAYNDNKQPWTRMLIDSGFAPEWRELILAYPERFVLAFDNVFHFHWEGMFLPQVDVWRKALATIPDEVAHAIAHGNAERLWSLPPS
jgi:predicted TIM-barrel fold metal-dependent hydrolase